MYMKKSLVLIFLLLSFNSYAYEQLVINKETEFESLHDNRFTLMLGVNPSLTKSSNITNFSFSYGKKFDDFWLDTNLLVTNGIFRELSANNPTATGATDLQLEDQKNSLMTIGIGVGRETRYAQTLLPFEDMYEYMAANLTYNSYKEDFSGESFTGPGLLAKFALYKRFNDYFSAGGHFNYNLAVVRRGELATGETSSARSLTLGFLTIGLDLSFYL